MTTNTENTKETSSYIVRNEAWLKPFIACLIVASGPKIMQVVDPELSASAEGSWVGWLTVIGLSLGGACLGYGLTKAQTLTARMVLFAMLGLSLGAVIEAFLSL